MKELNFNMVSFSTRLSLSILKIQFTYFCGKKSHHLIIHYWAIFCQILLNQACKSQLTFNWFFAGVSLPSSAGLNE